MSPSQGVVRPAVRPQDLWVGANFWSRHGGPLMWRDLDVDLLRQELAVLRRHGLTMTRSFLYWPDAMPTADCLDPAVLDRFRTFLDLHTQEGLQTVPTFIVGHMSGENWDPVWRDGRDLYADTWMVARQAWFIREVTRQVADHSAVTGWLVSNEMPIYGGAAPQSMVTSWAELMVQAVRAGGGAGPVSIGDGAWGIEVTGRDNGFSVRELAARTDFVGPHVYPMETDRVRQHLKAAFICELAAVGDRPVVLEEDGLTSDFASEENAAHYYRHVLHLTLLAGARGWIAWNNTDFDPLAAQDPYRHHPFELHFGLTRADGTPKAALQEMSDFACLLQDVDLQHCNRWASPVALVVPAYLEVAEPLTIDEAERTYVFDTLEQAYIACREADLPPGLVRERDGVDTEHRLFIVPSTKALMATTWQSLEERARSGAAVYASYGPGTVDFQRGPWWTGMEALFGVRHRLEYGLTDQVEDDVVRLQFEQSLGGIEAGETLQLTVGEGVAGRSFLPVESVGAQVLARDAYGRVALTRHQIGEGTAYFCAYPLEAFAASRAGANPEDTWRLYAALGRECTPGPPVSVDHPEVLVDGVDHEDGHALVWLVNLSRSSQRVTPRVLPGYVLADRAGTPTEQVDLEPCAVQVLRLQRASTTEIA